MKRLVLWDIDGTILHGGKLWKECFVDSLRECCESGFGCADNALAWNGMPQISFSGKTDRQICRELLHALGVWPDGVNHGEHPRHDARIDAVLRGYLGRARERVLTRSHEVKLLDGATALIDALEAREQVTLGLLTGNIREGAALKLQSVGIDPTRFKVGVYGDDHWNRYELPAIAIERARATLGLEFSGNQVVIIGDTIHDIGCGQKVGARAIGVGTGHGESRSRVLAAWQGRSPGDPRPDHYFEDLTDFEAVLAAILGPKTSSGRFLGQGRLVCACALLYTTVFPLFCPP